MIKGTILDRRSCDDRREGGLSTYTGPDRRKSGDRRDEKITICVFCEQICGDKKSWFKSSNLKDHVRITRFTCVTSAPQSSVSRFTLNIASANSCSRHMIPGIEFFSCKEQGYI